MAIEEIIDRKGEAEGHRTTVDETISPESRAVMDKAVKRAFFHDVASFEAKKPKIPLCVILPFLVAASNTSEFKISRFSNRPAYNISPRVGTFMNRTAWVKEFQPETPSTKQAQKDTSPTWFSTPYIPIYDGRNIEDLPILNETKEFNLKKDDAIMAGTSFFVKEDDWNLLPVWILLCKESEESNDTDDIEDFEEGY
ncbi:hypothetical protein BC829DRAFT_397452 [Chytridium lagenaria]|nr:hypothetical protein BC829DRAFT_397452 [Chytridium lagenaria]